MSIYRKAGLVVKRSGLAQELFQQLKIVDFRPVQKIEFKFNPFHSASKQIRDLSFHFSSARVRETNIKCGFKTTIVSDSSPPEVTCKLENGKTLIFNLENLTTLEVVKTFNQVVLPLLPPPPEPVAAVTTKSQKKK